MFNQLIFKLDQCKNLNLCEPDSIVIEDSEGNSVHYSLLRGASDYIYKHLGLKASTSKEIFKLNQQIWENLRDFLVGDCEARKKYEYDFSFNNPNNIALSSGYDIVDITSFKDEERVELFKQKLEKFTLEVTTDETYSKFYTEGKGGLVKLVCYDKNINPAEQDYTPVVIIEFNFNKSEYKIYTGILIYEVFTFLPSISTYSEFHSLIDLIENLDLVNPLKFATENAQELYDSYQNYKTLNVEVSARELISILRNVGYKLTLKSDDQLDEIANLNDEEGNLKIQEFFNTFALQTGETACDILALSELKKIFKFNKLTLLDVLTIMSKEYLTYEGAKITADTLSSIVFNLYDKTSDKKQIESLKASLES